MVTHFSTLRWRCGRRRERIIVGAHLYSHGDPLAGMVTGLLAAVTTLLAHGDQLLNPQNTLWEVVGARHCWRAPIFFMVTHLLAW